MNVSGTVVNYYFHCKRQCWLFANRINMEDNSEDVRIGRVIHELKLKDAKNTEVMIENIRVDKLTKEYLEELKKSDADVEAVKWQTLYYLADGEKYFT
ncbi:MAG: Dna2/Cas4 domain-containing protein, partial [Syntrophomonadaceae bacterium]|nr:Dna2/Cas4 domain-containing protein [Syntrophomonadaceae bacterium]